MQVKASGASLATATAADFVEVETAPLLALLKDDPTAGDPAVAEAFAAVEARSGRRPSVEAMLHAVCLERGGAVVVGHTHSVPVMALLCSPPRRRRLSTHMLFPHRSWCWGGAHCSCPTSTQGSRSRTALRDDLVKI